MRRILAVLLIFLCVVSVLPSCKETNEDPTEVQRVFAILGQFQFDIKTSNGYVFEHVQTMNGKKTNSRQIVLTLLSGGTSGTLIEIVSSLNPDISGEEYITQTSTIAFNGTTVQKNGVATDEYSVEQIVSLDLSHLYTACATQVGTYANCVLSVTVPAEQAGALLGDASDVSAVSIQIMVNDAISAIKSISIAYTRGGAAHDVKLTIN